MKKLLATTAIMLMACNASAKAPERDAPLNTMSSPAWVEFYKKTPALNVAPAPVSYNDIYFLNKKLNYAIAYKTDLDGRFQTADESLALKSGDCEDFAILKWEELRKAGVAESDMEFVFGVVQDSVTKKYQFHMVLWVWLDGKTYYLDNNSDDINVNLLSKGSYTTFNREGIRNYSLDVDSNQDGIIDTAETLKQLEREERFDSILKKRMMK